MKCISIIGGGIGGLTLGNILKKQGLDFTIYESAPEIKPVGSGIMMAVNAMQVFDTLGLKEQIEKAGNKIHSIAITDPHLKNISTTNVLALERKYNSCNVAIHRADLQKILADSLGSERIKLNHSLATIDNAKNNTLHFENGKKIQSDLIFGADGIHSKLRTQVLQTGKIRDTGQLCWRGLAEFNLPESYQREAVEAWGKGKRFGFVKMTGTKIYWYAVINKSIHQQDRTVADHFHGFHPLMTDIMQTTLPENIIFNEITDLSPIPKWYSGNLCLIGDAAHATTPNLGQGACQAIEDAYILGKLYEENKDFNAKVFEQFQKIRRRKVLDIVKTSRQIGNFSQWENATALRNFLMRITPEMFTQRLVEKVIRLEIR